MKSSKTFNNISDKLKAQIPKLKPREVVLFQMTNGVPNPEPDEAERSKDPILYGKVQLLTQFRIYDKYQKDSEGNEVGGYVDCGCVDSWVGDQPAKFRCYVTGQGQYARFQGKFQLQGGVVADEELYEIFYLSPQREGSPCADPSVETIFKIVDQKAEISSSVGKFESLKKAMEILENITPAKAREVFAALNQPNYQDDGVVIAKIKDFGRTNYELFLKTYNAPSTPVKGVIKESIGLGVISHDPGTGEVKMGDQVLCVLKTSKNADFGEVFSKWLDSAENGEDVLNNIKKQLSSAKEAKA